MSVTSRRRSSYYRRDSRRRRYGTRHVAGSGAIELLARFGLVARGIIYVVIGAIAVMLALGAAQHAPDRAGALEAIASKPFGYILLWVITIGFGGLALWKLVQAAVARLNPTEAYRLRAIGSAIGYTIACITTYWFVRFGQVPASSDTTSRDLTATVMSHSGGQFLVLIAGLIAVVAGIYMVIQAFRLDFTRYLRMGWMSGRTQDTVVTLGRFGYAARGVIVFLIGVTLIAAAASYDAAKATGIDGALRTIAGWPYGPILLILVALGLIAFGVLSFFEAKWRRTFGGVPV
jgi:Domain of Unknown Function (DUF1206)